MFGSARRIEADLGLNRWDAATPDIMGMRVSAYLPGKPAAPVMVWGGALPTPAQSVDQRLKMPTLMEVFKRAGGVLHVQTVTLDDLDAIAAGVDLCVVAAGKGEVSSLFSTNRAESPFEAPQRTLAMAYVQSDPGDESLVNFNVVPEIGEFITYPALSMNGPCQILLFESVPGGPAERWRAGDGRRLQGAAVLDRLKEILGQYFLPEHARFSRRELIDERAAICGAFTPVVRHPVGALPSGRQVLGMADVVVLNDPITAQGANNAVKCAAIYADAIAEHDGPFDAAFMDTTFARYWEIAGPATRFTTQFLGSSPAHAQELHAAAVHTPAVADRFAATMDDPRDADYWILDPEKARDYLQVVTRPTVQPL